MTEGERQALAIRLYDDWQETDTSDSLEIYCYDRGYQQGRADERAKVIDFILANVGFDCDNCSLRDNCGCDCKQALLEQLKEKSDD